MARQLDEAKRKAAEYIDLQGDLNTELKNMASDTRVFDTARDAISVLGNVASSAVSSFALLTGSEESARQAVVAFTTAQSAMSGAISIGNALQKQSNVMLAVATVQKWAAAKATEAEASATVGATVAQKAFNLVAKANPYVLLATAIIAVTAAIGAFIIANNKAEDAQKKLRKEMHETSLQGQRDAQTDITKLNVLYAATQNVKLSMEDRMKAVDALQRQYPGYFGDLEKEKILVGEASDAYKQLTNDILATAMARAYEKKIQTLAEERVELEDQLELQKRITESAEKMRHSWETPATQASFGAGQINMTTTGHHTAEQTYDVELRKLNDIKKNIQDNTAAQQKYLDKIQETIPAQNRLSEGTTKVTTPTNGSTNTVSEIQAVAGSIAELEKQISDAQTAAKKGLLPEELKDPVKYKAYIGSLQKQLKELKIKWGFEKPETKLQELQAEVEKAKAEFVIAVDADDSQAQIAAYQAYKTAQKKLDDYKLTIELKPEIDEATLAKQAADIQEKVSNALNPKTELSATYDFGGLGNFEDLEKFQQPAQDVIDAMKRIEDARNELTEVMNSPDATDAQIAAAQEGLEELNGAYDQLREKADVYQTLSDESDKLADKNKKLAKTYNTIADCVGSVGDAFSALSSLADDDPALKVFGIVAQAVANMFAGYAQAVAQAGSMGPWAWAAFAAAGLAQTLAMVAQIKQATTFAEGGIVGGSSYAGDRLYARINSGEMILNSRQQRNLFNLLDTTAMPQRGGTNVQVQGVIRGTDLLLVQKNTNSVLKKAGSEIHF